MIHNKITDRVNATNRLLYLNPSNRSTIHTKAVAGQVIVSVNKRNGGFTTIILATMLFGERDATSTPEMVENARAGRGEPQIANGTSLFDFKYIRNADCAHVLAAKGLLREFTATELVPEDSKVNWDILVITDDDPWAF